MISGGIDSPVAAWMLIRKGIEPVFAYFDNYPLCDQAAEGIALETMKTVCHATGLRNIRVYLISHSQDLQDIASKCPLKFACMISRRMMLRISERIALNEQCVALVAGDALGQKASQTIENITAADSVLTRLHAIRPLIGMNKMQIEKFAKRIGTYEISIRPGVAGCGVPTPNPSTAARQDRLKTMESALDIESMIKRAVDGARILTIP